MARVFVSFLGTGGQTDDYASVEHSIGSGDEEINLIKSKFAQCAEIYWLHQNEKTVERYVFFATEKSRRLHGALIQSSIESIVGSSIEDRIIWEMISEYVDDPSSHWSWFEKLNGAVGEGDTVVLDVSHGKRVVPIVLSAAIGFVSRVRNAAVEHVFYGDFDTEKKRCKLVDVQAMYVVQSWADAVARLIDTGDARELSRLARANALNTTFARLSSDDFTACLHDLTVVLRNVEVHKIAKVAATSLKVIKDKEADPRINGVERELLRIVREKFGNLISLRPVGDRYSIDYLLVQLAAAQLLLENDLVMQAFTVLREFVGSVGMLALRGGKHDKSIFEEETKQRRLADLFIRKVYFVEEKFSEDDANSIKKHLASWFLTLQGIGGRFEEFRSASRVVIDLRNALDHGGAGGGTLSSVLVKRQIAGSDPAAATIAEGQRLVAISRELIKGISELPQASEA